jgi:hypothetical protein
MYNHTNVLSLQKLAVKAELGNQANLPTHSHWLMMCFLDSTVEEILGLQKSTARGLIHVCE